jgi:hypothetical protein
MYEPTIHYFEVNGVDYFVASAKTEAGDSFHTLRQDCQDLHILTGSTIAPHFVGSGESFESGRQLGR